MCAFLYWLRWQQGVKNKFTRSLFPSSLKAFTSLFFLAPSITRTGKTRLCMCVLVTHGHVTRSYVFFLLLSLSFAFFFFLKYFRQRTEGMCHRHFQHRRVCVVGYVSECFALSRPVYKCSTYKLYLLLGWRDACFFSSFLFEPLLLV